MSTCKMLNLETIGFLTNYAIKIPWTLLSTCCRLRRHVDILSYKNMLVF